MSTTGLVLKPLTPAEATKSRSISGAARSAAPTASSASSTSGAAVNPTSVVDRPQANEGSFVSTYMRQQEAKDKKAAAPNTRPEQSRPKTSAKGRATPGSGILSSDVLFVLQSDSGQTNSAPSPQIGRAQSGSVGGVQGSAGSIFSPRAPQALSAYSRTQESVDRTRIATASRFAAEGAVRQEDKSAASLQQAQHQVQQQAQQQVRTGASATNPTANDRAERDARTFTEKVTALPSELQASVADGLFPANGQLQPA